MNDNLLKLRCAFDPKDSLEFVKTLDPTGHVLASFLSEGEGRRFICLKYEDAKQLRDLLNTIVKEDEKTPKK